MDEDVKSNKPVPEISVEPTPPTSQDMPVYQTEVVPEEITEETPETLAPENFEPQVSIPPPPQEPSEENHRGRFFIIAGGVIFFLLLFIIILRIFSGSAKKQPVTLEYWGLWESEEVMKPLIAEYERKNPTVKIKYSRKDPQNFREKLLARGKDGRGPDIFRFHNTWVPSMKEILSPLPSKVMTESEFKNTFYPVAATDLKVEKFYYGIPLEIDGLVMVYNEDLFKKSGIELAPKTWEDVIDYANRITVKDTNNQIITSGLAIGTASNIEHFSDILGWMLLQNGADFKKISAPEGVETLSAYRKFAEIPDAIWDENMPNSISAFTQEKVGMIIVPSWEILTIKEANPDLNFRVISLPIVPGGSQVSLASYWVEGVSRYSKKQVAAWEFLKFLTTKESQTKLFAEASKTRLFGEPYSRIDLRDSLLSNQYVGPVVEQAPKMKSLPVVSRTYDNGINDEIIRYLTNAVNSTINGVSALEAMTNAQTGVSQVLTKYGIN